MATFAATATIYENLLKQGTVYATVRSGSTSDNTPDGTAALCEATNSFSAPTYSLYRSVVAFNLSTLPSGVNITSAVLGLYGWASSVTDAFNAVIVSGTALAGTIVVADYGELLAATTSYGTYAATAWVNSAWNNISLNSAGLNAITKAGTTYFAVRHSFDINNQAATSANYVQWLGDNDPPRLTITYAAGEFAGVIAVVETRFHYFDATGAERYLLGTPV
mgnify:CR=1 FL=1